MSSFLLRCKFPATAPDFLQLTLPEMNHFSITELCESFVLPILHLPLMHVIYGRQHQTSFVHGQRNLHSDLQVVIHVGHTFNAKANLKSMQDHLLYFYCHVCIISHPPHEILTTSWMQNRKLNNFELILMQVLYLVEVLLMTFDLLTFGNSQQVNDCHPVFLRNNLLLWN